MEIQWHAIESLRIQLPPENCAPHEMKTLCMQVCEVIRAKKSVLVAINGSNDVSMPVDAKEPARENLTFRERQMYEHWEN